MGKASNLQWFVLTTLTLLLFAGASHYRAGVLQERAAARQADSAAAGDRFLDTFDAADQDAELRLLDERRTLLVRASGWRRV
ncbi:MAG: hypothetical protein ACK4N5_00980, partial [Myxococcales bacterium]